MSRVRLVVLMAMASLLLVPAIALAQSFPQMPCRIRGTVELDGAPVPDGTVVTATIEGVQYSTTTPVVGQIGARPYGNSTYALLVQPPDGKFYDEGTPIAFTVDGYVADQQATFQSGTNLVTNLTALRTPLPTPTPSPTPTPIPTPTPSPEATTSPQPTPEPTLPPATPTPTPPPVSLNIGRLVGLIIFGIVDLLLIALVAWLGWRLLRRRRSEPPSEEPPRADRQ